MLRSHVIEVDGAFLGAAIQLPPGYRFVAADLRVEELDGSFWPSLDDARRVARQLYRTGNLPQARTLQAA